MLLYLVQIYLTLIADPIADGIVNAIYDADNIWFLIFKHVMGQVENLLYLVQIYRALIANPIDDGIVNAIDDADNIWYAVSIIMNMFFSLSS